VRLLLSGELSFSSSQTRSALTDLINGTLSAMAVNNMRGCDETLGPYVRRTKAGDYYLRSFGRSHNYSIVRIPFHQLRMCLRTFPVQHLHGRECCIMHRWNTPQHHQHFSINHPPCSIATTRPAPGIVENPFCDKSFPGTFLDSFFLCFLQPSLSIAKRCRIQQPQRNTYRQAKAISHQQMLLLLVRCFQSWA